jgi:pyruvate,orthophosphate dikinase
MIEIPRAALTADEIAAEAQFFSFGTNDLTQMGMGFSRDDAAKFLGYYVEKDILPQDPFVSLDCTGMGQLVKIGFDKGRAANENLKVGICGEHGGDPSSIQFFHEVGLDYVSCSPFRVPIARLVAAQSALKEKKVLAKPTGKKKAKKTKAIKLTPSKGKKSASEKVTKIGDKKVSKLKKAAATSRKRRSKKK